jgi:hypothetical protein
MQHGGPVPVAGVWRKAAPGHDDVDA